MTRRTLEDLRSPSKGKGKGALDVASQVEIGLNLDRVFRYNEPAKPVEG